MKKITILLALVTILFASCDEKGINAPSFSIDKLEEGIFAAPEGGTEYLRVASTVEWIASANQPWLSVSPANGIGDTKCSVLVDSTLENGVREAKLTFETVEGDRYTVKVEQGGFAKFISLKDSVKTIDAATNNAEDRYFELEVSSNVGFKISVVDSTKNPIQWIAPKQTEVTPNFDRPSRPRTTKVRFDWKINSDTLDRVAFINFLPLSDEDKVEKPALLTLTQDAAPVISDDRTGDSLAVVTIINRLQLLSPWDTSENMQYWNNVTLWEGTDKEILKGEVPREAIGRVRKATFMMCNTKESLPLELRYLKYLETLDVYSNVNTMLLDIELGSEICQLQYLKHLRIGSYGLVSLPDDFKNLKNLESLSLESNNFTEVPSILTKKNFPNLKSLNLLHCRRWIITGNDLRKKDEQHDGVVGLYFNASESDALKRLFLWDSLEELWLNNNYIEGSLPEFEVGDIFVDVDTTITVRAWTQDDIKGDTTLQKLVHQEKPRILPNMKTLKINLNFFTGELPEWLLYHPHLLDWLPESLIYPQQDKGFDSKGKAVGFSNVPTNYDKYYEFFPGYREKYEIKEARE